MAPRIGVVVFPGTNCEHDVVQAVEAAGGAGALLWHGDHHLGSVDAVVLRAASPTATTCGPGPWPVSRPSWTAVAGFARGGRARSSASATASRS